MAAWQELAAQSMKTDLERRATHPGLANFGTLVRAAITMGMERKATAQKAVYTQYPELAGEEAGIKTPEKPAIPEETTRELLKTQLKIYGKLIEAGDVEGAEKILKINIADLYSGKGGGATEILAPETPISKVKTPSPSFLSKVGANIKRAAKATFPGGNLELMKDEYGYFKNEKKTIPSGQYQGNWIYIGNNQWQKQ